MELIKVLASTCRQKILRVLIEVKRTHMMNLVRKTNSNYNQVNRNLIILEKEKIVKIVYCGRMKIIRMNMDNPRVKVIIKALKVLSQDSPTFKE
jgi:hypothetical protein